MIWTQASFRDKTHVAGTERSVESEGGQAQPGVREGRGFGPPTGILGMIRYWPSVRITE